jgi:hypothetical protein
MWFVSVRQSIWPSLAILQNLISFRFLHWISSSFDDRIISIVLSQWCCYCRRSRSQSCPFCRDSLKRVNSADLWIYTDNKDIIDVATVRRENLRRLFMYIDKLPTVIPESVFDVYDSHVKWQSSPSANCFMYLLLLLVLSPGPLVLLCLFFWEFRSNWVPRRLIYIGSYTLNVSRTCSIILRDAIWVFMVV